MKFCDITLSYHETSGGIRTYLDEKRRYLLEHTNHEHVLIIPDEEDSVEHSPRALTYRIASPTIPGYAPYRMFWRPDKISHILEQEHADVIELGSFYAAAWAVRHHHDDRERRRDPCCIGGYFHTDVAEAFVSGPLRRAIDQSVSDWSPTLETIGYKIADFLAGGVESYIKSVFEHCDLRMAASRQQADRLQDYGVDEVHVVPLGIDLHRFHPSKRSPEIRAQLDLNPDDFGLIYAGRLVNEKRVELLLDAVSQLPNDLNAQLRIMGEGPLREALEQRAASVSNVKILPYEKDQNLYAAKMASSDLYVTAGPFETFGLSVIEAQAAGLPTIGVQAGALIERVPPQTGILVPVDDATSFARAIETAYGRRQEFSNASRRHVEENFSWDKTFQTQLALYDQLITHKSLPAD